MLSFRDYNEFNKYMGEIDAGMRRDNVPILARQIQAFSRISCENGGMEFNISDAMDLNNEDIQGFEGDALTRRIIIWFEELYGDRLKIKFFLGKSVTLIRNDPYIMDIPFFIGEIRFTYDTETLGRSGQIAADGQTIVNVFDHLPDITKATVARVSRSEALRLANELMSVSYRYRQAARLSDYENTFNVRTDLDFSAEHIVSGHSNFGMSRWHSLQAAEKALKSVLSYQGIDYPKTHDLYDPVHKCGMLVINPFSLSFAMCSPSVRYESGHSTLDQAINAHYAALDICSVSAERTAKIP